MVPAALSPDRSWASIRARSASSFPAEATETSPPVPGSTTPIRDIRNPPTSTAIRHASRNSSSRSVRPYDQRVDRAQDGVDPVQPPRSCVSASFCSVMSSPMLAIADHVAGGRTQEGVVPADEPALARTRHDLVLVVSRLGRSPARSVAKKLLQSVQLGWNEKVEAIPPENLLLPPAGQAKQVLVAVGDPALPGPASRDTSSTFSSISLKRRSLSFSSCDVQLGLRDVGSDARDSDDLPASSRTGKPRLDPAHLAVRADDPVLQSYPVLPPPRCTARDRVWDRPGGSLPTHDLRIRVQALTGAAPDRLVGRADVEHRRLSRPPRGRRRRGSLSAICRKRPSLSRRRSSACLSAVTSTCMTTAPLGWSADQRRHRS